MSLRLLFIYAIVFTGITNPLLAQTEKKQSLSLSFYPATMYAITQDKSTYMHGTDIFTGKEFEALFGDYGYKAVGYDTRHYGAYEISYNRFLSRLLRLNLGLGCELSSKHWDLYDNPNGPETKRIIDYRIFLLPGIDFIILNKPKNKIWFTGQAGLKWIHRGLNYFPDNERNKKQFAWQFWLVFDRKIIESLSIDFGAGYGTLGFFKVGITYPL